MQLPARPSTSRRSLAERYREIRAATERLCDPLSTEDYVVQSMPDTSPTKWHLAHVSWFFETFVLKPYVPDHRSRDDDFEYLFNSYYNRVGEQYPRPRRGLLSRPTVDEVYAYRTDVDRQMSELLEHPDDLPDELLGVIELGLNHEQQHQELILMDIKHVLSCNPLFPAYRERRGGPRPVAAAELKWIGYPEKQRAIGHEGPGFCYDNELPRHQVHLRSFDIASRPVTNGEYLEFIASGGYQSPEHWLADGWTAVQDEQWEAPLYWVRQDDGWHEFTLSGLQPLEPHAPVCHVSYFEADAFSSWAGHRLPTEAEWEVAASERPIDGNFSDDGPLHPLPAAFTDPGPGPRQIYGDVWEWTRSAYSPYPGFRARDGALGEYNGKFMCNQYVLRGGACVTPRSHIRPTYRNFFYPHCRWQFSGIRLARDAR